MSVLQGDTATRSVTATDPDGTVIGFSATVTPAAAGISITSQTPAAAAGGTASATVSVASTVAPGTYTVEMTATNGDATPQSGTCSFTVTVTEIKPIGAVQGSVATGGLTIVRRSRRSPATARGRPCSSRASSTRRRSLAPIRAQTSSASSSRTRPHRRTGTLPPRTGSGSSWAPSPTSSTSTARSRRTSRRSATRSCSEATSPSSSSSPSSPRPRLVARTGTALDVDALIPPVDANPPAVFDDANTYWERLESMRLRVPANSLITDGRDVFPATADAEMWLVRGDSRSRRGAGTPAGLPRCASARRSAGSRRQRQRLPDPRRRARPQVARVGQQLLLPPTRTFGRVTNALVGGLNFSFNKYRIETT